MKKFHCRACPFSRWRSKRAPRCRPAALHCRRSPARPAPDPRSDHRHARRARAACLLQHAAREVRDAVVHRAREVAGVGRQVGDAEAAAQHGPVVPLIRGADPRSPVVVGRIPQVAAVAVDARERDRPGRAEGALRREIPRRHAVGPLGRPRLHFHRSPRLTVSLDVARQSFCE